MLYGAHSVRLVRQLVMPVLKMTAFDMSVTHHWVRSAKVFLNSFRHKGYWYHGRSREAETMLRFGEIVKAGDRVVECGGHIGYISMYLASLVGTDGVVDVFEPGSNNLPYIRRNIEQYVAKTGRTVNLIECALGPSPGKAVLYEDDLTGQNNSLVRDFETFGNNAAAAHVRASVAEREVTVTTVDQHVGKQAVDFVKIDVEGFEWGVLQGMQQVLKLQRPALMIEMTKHIVEMRELLCAEGYRFFAPDGSEVCAIHDMRDNVFALHPASFDRLRNTAFELY